MFILVSSDPPSGPGDAEELILDVENCSGSLSVDVLPLRFLLASSFVIRIKRG